MNALENYAIRATDGITRYVKHFYFKNEAWVVRYLVIDTGSWLASRTVLISPIALGHPDWTKKALPMSVTEEQVKSSPHINIDRPASRQHEMRYLRYQGYSPPVPCLSLVWASPVATKLQFCAWEML